MKYLSLSLLVLMTGCSQGKVDVTSKISAENPVHAQDAVVNDQGAHGAGGSEKDQKHVFFEQVLLEQGVPQYLISISFLAQDSKTPNPFGIALTRAQEFNAHATFYPGRDSYEQVTYLRSIGYGSDSVVTTSLRTLKTSGVHTFARPAVDFSISKQGKMAALDNKGVVTLQGQPLSLDAKALSLAWNATGERLLVRTDSAAWVYAFEDEKLILNRIILDVSASQWNAEGNALAYVKKNKFLYVAHFEQPNDRLDEWKGALESSEVYDLSWGNQGLIYWTRLPSGIQEIRRVVLKNEDEQDSLKEKTIVQLSVPSQIKNGVVCPVADGEMLYYSDFDDGTYVIEKMKLGKRAQPKLFSKAIARDEGLVCPKI